MTKKLKISLLENSHSFIEEALIKAVLAETDPIQWKYAIFSLVQSIELILKERLRREHSVLIYQNIDKPINTVGLDLAISRLNKISGIQFSDNDIAVIQTAKSWRNVIVHYEFDFSPKELKLVFARLLGFSMHFNKLEFDISLAGKIKTEAWEEALSIIEYASELYERARKIIEEENIEPEFIWDCPNCGYDTFVFENEINCCYVCGFAEEVVECLGCGDFYFESETKEYQVDIDIYERFCNDCYNKKSSDDYYDYMNRMEMDGDYY
jgi:transcription elongation factor Elf1